MWRVVLWYSLHLIHQVFCREEYINKLTYSSNNKYVFVDSSLDFWQANTFCNMAFGTTLATVSSVQEDNLIRNLCDSSDAGRVSCWIGLTSSFNDLNDSNLYLTWMDPVYNLHFNNNIKYTLFTNFYNGNSSSNYGNKDLDLDNHLARDCTASTYCNDIKDDYNNGSLWTTKHCDLTYTFVCNYNYYDNNHTNNSKSDWIHNYKMYVTQKNKNNYKINNSSSDYVYVSSEKIGKEMSYFEANGYCNIKYGSTLCTGDILKV